MKKLGIYIHIPFCIRKCNYCDFLSFEGTSNELHIKYVNALNQEIEHHSKVYGNNFMVDSIFFGGGTPTLIEANLIKSVLETIKLRFNVLENAEITIECNPKTVDEKKLEIYRKSGINRISIGVQTMDDLTLKSLGRVHKSSEAEETYRLARENGYKNVNLDLMFAVPGHNIDTWIRTLEKAVLLNPEHISFYSLQLEEGTKFFEMFKNEELDMVPEEIDREMYHYAVNFLTKRGYKHYEISNCAKDGFECKHNLKYWSLEDYLGLGIGAHSFIEGVRFSNTRKFDEYIDGLNNVLDVKSVGINFYKENYEKLRWIEWLQVNTKQDQMVDFMITGLRKTKGIDLDEFKFKFGESLFEAYPDQEVIVLKYMEKGLMSLENNILKFTIKGIDVSNTVLAEFV